MKKIIVVSIIATILISGCVGKYSNPKTTPTVNDSIPIPENAKKVVDLAKSDLAEKLSISVSDITFNGVEAITWPDSSLGYPKSGEQYLPVETPGYKIFLLYNGKSYEYHSDYDKIVPPPAEK